LTESKVRQLWGKHTLKHTYCTVTVNAQTVVYVRKTYPRRQKYFGVIAVSNALRPKFKGKMPVHVLLLTLTELAQTSLKVTR